MLRSLEAVLILALAVLVIAGVPRFHARTATAQQGAPSIIVAAVDAAQYPDITAIVTALDQRGVPASRLAAGDFHAFDGDTPLTVTAAQPAQDANIALTVVLMLDTSGSMAGAPINAAKQAATEFVQALGPNDQAALFAFSGQVRPVVPLTSDKSALTAGIAGMQANGPTSLFEAAQTAIYGAGVAPSPRKAVVLLTDGQNDTESPVTSEGSLGVARDAGIPVFSIGFGGADVSYLQTLSAETRGQFRNANATNVSDVYAQISQLLRSQYVLTVNGGPPADGAGGTLRVVATIGGVAAEGAAPFVRGVAPVAPVTLPAPADDGGGGGNMVVFLAAGGLAAIALLGAGAIVGTRRLAYARAQHGRERVAGRYSAAEMPPPAADDGMDRIEDGRGRLTGTMSDGGDGTLEFGSRPVSIGSSPRSTVRLDASADVAPQHALVWMREGKIMLRHVGGPRRMTLVAGRPVEWVILDEGDVFEIGPYRYQVVRAK